MPCWRNFVIGCPVTRFRRNHDISVSVFKHFYSVSRVTPLASFSVAFISFPKRSLKSKSCFNANFLVTGAPQFAIMTTNGSWWQQIGHHDNSRFSVLGWVWFCLVWQFGRVVDNPMLIQWSSARLYIAMRKGYRADSRLAPSQWETALLCNDVSHWLGTNLKSTLWYIPV